MWPCIRAKLRWRSLTLIKPEVSLYSHERVLLFTCNFSFFIWTKQTEVAERMGDKRPLLWQRHRETPLGGSKHRRTLYSASQGGRKTTVAWQHSRASQRHWQPRPGSNRSGHAFKQGSNGAIIIKEWVLGMGEKATSVDQSPKTRWDREDSVDIRRNRGLGKKKCVPTLPLAFELISSRYLATTPEKWEKGS